MGISMGSHMSASIRRVLLVDDHPLFGEAVRAVFHRLAPDVEVDHATTLGEAIEMLCGKRVDVEAQAAFELVLLDINLPDSSALEGLSRLRAIYPDLTIVVISAIEHASVIDRATALGARGFIPKSATIEEMRDALTVILAGGSWVPQRSDAALRANRLPALTPTQSKIMVGLLDGKLNKQIAFEIGVTEATIKGHMTEIFRRLGVRSRTQAVIAARSLLDQSGSTTSWS